MRRAAPPNERRFLHGFEIGLASGFPVGATGGALIGALLGAILLGTASCHAHELRGVEGR